MVHEATGSPPCSPSLLMGGRDMLNIWRKVACLDQRQREAIGLRVRHKESGLLKMPGYDALNDLFHLLDPAAYARALSAWLQANSGLPPRSLALDAKSIGDGKCRHPSWRDHAGLLRTATRLPHA